MSLSLMELKNLRSLLTRKGRRSQSAFSAEGVRVLEEAAHHGCTPLAVYYADGMLSERGEAVIERLRSREVPVRSLPAMEMRRICDTKSPQGILALFSTPDTELAQLYRSEFRTVLWCDRIADPTNLGTLIRSAAAFGFDMVVTSEKTVEPYSPKVVRASAGGIFALPIAVATRDDVLLLVKKQGFRLIASDLHGTDAADWTRDTNIAILLAIGSESEGLPTEIIDRADSVLRITHDNRVESLNAAVAGSILMREIYGCTRRS